MLLHQEGINVASERERARAQTRGPRAAYLKLGLLLGLGLTGVVLLGQTAFVQSASAAVAPPSGQRLRALAGSFLIGYASTNDFWTLPDAATYEATASSEFNVLTPENQLKWATVHPQQNTYNFAPGDQHVAFAQAHGMAVHGHNLAWGQYNPTWLENGQWTASTLTAVLYNHIDTVVGHYAGKVALWDVVNEPINTPSIWNNVIGPSYVDLALRRAHAADPAAALLINEYSAETQNGVSDALYNMAASLVASGSPLNGIGLEMHIDENGINLNSFSANMARFAALGLNIYITEMDVRLPAPPSATDLNNQATVYQNVLDRCRQQPACKGLQMWGFTDKYSWVPGFFSGMGAALIFDTNYVAKPSYYALQTRLGASVPTNTPVPATATATPVPPTATAIPPTATTAATSTPTTGPGTGSSASFVAQDSTTGGNWKGAYGSQGYWLEGDGQSVPAFAPVTISNALTYTWTNSTSDPRALLKAASSTDRLAAAWLNSQFVIDVNVTDGQTHKISLYAMDWDQGGRSEAVNVFNASTGALLDTRTMSNFVYGTYVSWTVSGHVQLRVTTTAPSTAVVNGLFFDPAAGPSGTVGPTASITPIPSTPTATAVPPTATTAATSTPTTGPGTGSSASFVAQDATTGGNWKGAYGSQGYWLEGDGQSVPAYAPVTISNASTNTWTSSTSDPRALLKAASSTDRLAAAWLNSQFVIDVNVTDGQTHKISLYAMDWDQGGRSETVNVVNASTGALLDTRTMSNFVYGTYVSWTVSGHVQLRVTTTAAATAVVNGLFFDPAAGPSGIVGPTSSATAAGSTPTPAPTGPSASFVAQDATTGGNWKGAYGSKGYWLEGDGQSVPVYAPVTISNASTYTWTNSTSDPRALRKAASSTDRLAAAWLNSQFVIDVNVTDGQTHKISLYAMDWDQGGRSEAVNVFNASTGALLDTRTMSNFVYGTYVSWTVSGHVQLRVTTTAAATAVVNGLFFD